MKQDGITEQAVQLEIKKKKVKTDKNKPEISRRDRQRKETKRLQVCVLVTGYTVCNVTELLTKVKASFINIEPTSNFNKTNPGGMERKTLNGKDLRGEKNGEEL